MCADLIVALLLAQEPLALFTGPEFRALLCGPLDIDVDDWEKNTVYSRFSPDSVVIKWFWTAVRSFSGKVRCVLFHSNDFLQAYRGTFQ